MDHLDIGNMILLSFADIDERFTGILVGKKVGDGLMVYANLPEESRRRLRKNNAVLVQFAQESTLLGFQAQASPEHHDDCILHLSWPHSVEDMNRRSSPRVPCHFPGRIRLGETIQPCLVEDIGEKGMRVRLHGADADQVYENLEPGQSLSLDFAPFGPDPLYKADCTVLRTFHSSRKPYAVLLMDQVDQELDCLIHHHIERVLEESC